MKRHIYTSILMNKTVFAIGNEVVSTETQGACPSCAVSLFLIF